MTTGDLPIHRSLQTADHSDRTGKSTWVLAELMKQGGRRFFIAPIADARAIEAIRAKAKVGDAVSVSRGGSVGAKR